MLSIEGPHDVGIVRAHAGPAALDGLDPVLLLDVEPAPEVPGKESGDLAAVAGDHDVVRAGGFGEDGFPCRRTFEEKADEFRALDGARGSLLEIAHGVDPESSRFRVGPDVIGVSFPEFLEAASVPVHDEAARPVGFPVLLVLARALVGEDDALAVRGEERPGVVGDLVENDAFAFSVPRVPAEQLELGTVRMGVGLLGILLLGPDDACIGAGKGLDLPGLGIGRLGLGRIDVGEGGDGAVVVGLSIPVSRVGVIATGEKKESARGHDDGNCWQKYFFHQAWLGGHAVPVARQAEMAASSDLN